MRTLQVSGLFAEPRIGPGLHQTRSRTLFLGRGFSWKPVWLLALLFHEVVRQLQRSAVSSMDGTAELVDDSYSGSTYGIKRRLIQCNWKALHSTLRSAREGTTKCRGTRTRS